MSTVNVNEKKTCPRCKLPALEVDNALNALSHDGKEYICSVCGQIEGFESIGAVHFAEGLKVGQRRAQAALYGLDEKGNPKIPREEMKK